MDITELKRNTDPKAGRHPWEKARANFIGFLLRRYHPAGRVVLDLGSGDAYLLSQLARQGAGQVFFAVDSAYTPPLIEQLSAVAANQPIHFYQAPSGIPADLPKADTCLLLDVIEHCEDDRAVLREAASDTLTAAGAYFFITTPAFQQLFSKHDIVLQHHRRYSRKQLKQRCEESGLTPVATGYFFSTLLPARLLQMIVEKIRKREPRHTLDGWKRGAFVSRIFYAILWADARICYLLSRAGLHLPGLSAYAICKKQPS